MRAGSNFQSAYKLREGHCVSELMHWIWVVGPMSKPDLLKPVLKAKTTDEWWLEKYKTYIFPRYYVIAYDYFAVIFVVIF